MSYLTLQNVSKRYLLGNTRIDALNDINLGIEEGEFTVIWGPSGCGKSTLLNILATIDDPSDGDYRVGEHSIKGMSDRDKTHLRQREIGVIFQNFNLVPVMTALENVMLPGQLSGGKVDPTLQARARKLMNEVGVEEYVSHRPDQLSGGQRQRVALARALINQPRLVIADEPTANLDSVNSQKIIDLLSQMNKIYSTTFIFSTHDQMLLNSARRKVELRDGKLASDITPASKKTARRNMLQEVN